MKKVMLASLCLFAAHSYPALAQHRGGGGGGFGAAFGGAALGGAVGSVLGNVLSQPQAPAPVYVAPPVVVERRVYVNPVYAAPIQHIVYHAWAGPGFACYDPEPSAVNRVICGSQDLSAASLAVAEAFYAAMQQTPYNAGALRAEYASFMQGERSNCAPYGYQQQVDCIAGTLSRERDTIVSRLSGVYADEANRPVTENVALQQRLHDIGLLPGTADGIYGDGTRRAIAMWQNGQGRPATGVLSTEEVALLTPGAQAPIPYVPAISQPPAPSPTPSPAPVVQASTPPTPAPSAPEASSDPLGGVHENMPYALARPKLFAAGWQTQFFKADGMSDQDRDARSWFTDHHINEVEDCSSSGCKMQFHNMDGRILYVYTQPGSHSSDAYRGAGPSVIAYCLDVDDITCPAPVTPQVRQASK